MPEVRLDTVLTFFVYLAPLFVPLFHLKTGMKDKPWSDDQVMQISVFLYSMLELHATCAVPHARRPAVLSQDAMQMLAIPLVVKASWCSNAHSKSVYRLLNDTEIAA